MKNLFYYKDYKSYLKQHIEENRAQRGYRQRLADACGCKSSFFSQVVNGSVHMSLDQAVKLTLYWGLSSLESEYFLNLVNYARSGSKELTRFCENKMKSLREQYEDLKSLRKSPGSLSEAHSLIYYSSWHYQAIHMLCSIGGFQNVEGIAEKMRMSTFEVQKILNNLFEIGLVEPKDGSWTCTEAQLHIGKESIFSKLNHMNWRNHVIHKIQTAPEKDLHFSACYTVSKKDYEVIRRLILQLIEEASEKVKASNDEELYALLIDSFQVSAD